MAAVEADADALVAVEQVEELAPAPRSPCRAGRSCPPCSRAGSGRRSGVAQRAGQSPGPPGASRARCGSPLRAPACRTTPSAPIPSPTRSAWVSEAIDFSRTSLSFEAAIDQVDGVDHRRLHRRGLIGRAVGGEVVVRVRGRAPHPGALVEDLDRVAARSPRLAGRPAVEASRRGDMGADQHRFLKKKKKKKKKKGAESILGKNKRLRGELNKFSAIRAFLAPINAAVY